MKVVFLNGSARKNGNTSKLLSMIEERMQDIGYKTVVLNISEYDINYCLGCHECEKETRKCVQLDGVNQIYDVLKTANVIAVASPSYWGYVTGQLKVFFDRSTAYCNAGHGSTTFPSGKKGVAIAIRAGSKEDENIEIIRAIEHYFSHLEIEPVARLMVESVINPEDLECEAVSRKIDEFVNVFRCI